MASKQFTVSLSSYTCNSCFPISLATWHGFYKFSSYSWNLPGNMILKKESIASTKGADNRWRPIINSLKHKGFLSSWDLYLQYILKWATDLFFFHLEIYCETIWFFSTQSHFSNVLCNNLLFSPKALILLFFKPLFSPSLKKNYQAFTIACTAERYIWINKSI